MGFLSPENDVVEQQIECYFIIIYPTLYTLNSTFSSMQTLDCSEAADDFGLSG